MNFNHYFAALELSLGQFFLYFIIEPKFGLNKLYLSIL